MRPPWEDGPGAVEAPPEPEPGSFDPGVETGYLRRTPREGPPPVELGGRPFDPGPEIGFNRRRAKRLRRNREREQRVRREAEERRLQAERERREAEERARREAEERARREAEELVRQQAEERERQQAEEREREAERARREAEERARREAERSRIAAERRSREAEARRLREAADRRRERADRIRQAKQRKRRTAVATRRTRAKRRRASRREAARRAVDSLRSAAGAGPARAAKGRRPQGRPPAKGRAQAKGVAETKGQAQAKPRLPKRRPAGESSSRKPPKKPQRHRAPTGSPGGASTKPTGASSPSPGTTRGPRPRRDSQQGVVAATIKAAVVLGCVTAAAALIGLGAGLPLPFEGSGTQVASSSFGTPGTPVTPSAPLGPGIAPALYRGPFHPVVGGHAYGEGGARFGAPRGGRLHEGQDVFAKPGTPLVAVRDGVVIERNGKGGHDYGGGGNWVSIYSPIENRSYVYLHMLKPSLVEIGERVEAGQPVGQVGCTGSCYGHHLHFEVRIGRATWGADTKAIDPLPMLRKWPQARQA